jgi:trans-L-3-hydroxyproline dehydratase
VITRIRTIDAHVGGQPVRLIVEGAPRPEGRSLARKAAWLRRHADRLRTAVVLAPRGHTDLLAALLTEPVAPGSAAGVVFMGADGYPAASADGLIAVATIALERQLLYDRAADQPERSIAFDTVSGTFELRARMDRGGEWPRVVSVVVTGLPSFVMAAGYPVRIGVRDLRVDIAYGGQFYAIVDTEAAGVPLTAARLGDLRRLAAEICRAIAGSVIRHPALPLVSGVSAVVFTGPPNHPESHLQAIAVTAQGVVTRSPGGNSMSAVMSVLDAMGLLPDDHVFVQEGLAGTRFRGRIARRTSVADLPAIVTEIEGTAWLVAEQTLLVDENDPMSHGMRM